MTTSRQPSRSLNDRSAKAIVVPPAIGLASDVREAADLAHRRQPADAGREREAGLGQLEGLAHAIDLELERGEQAPAGLDAAGIDFGLRQLAVAVGVESEASLEGRNLRLVDHDVEAGSGRSRCGRPRSG